MGPFLYFCSAMKASRQSTMTWWSSEQRREKSQPADCNSAAKGAGRTLLFETRDDDNADERLDAVDPQGEASAVSRVLRGSTGTEVSSLTKAVILQQETGRTTASSSPYFAGMPFAYLLRMLAVEIPQRTTLARLRSTQLLLSSVLPSPVVAKNKSCSVEPAVIWTTTGAEAPCVLMMCERSLRPRSKAVWEVKDERTSSRS